MSKETRFTRGEWKVSKAVSFDSEMGNIGEVTMLSIGSRIHQMCHHGLAGECSDYDEQTANAHLIKTAPKLYAILDEICNLAGNDDQTIADEMVMHFDDIEKLLAEARGE